ncbi:PEP/pyruvate-binding domain-containing protein [Natrialba aegyptia]|uniref:Phosphoenolpyruvate synthase / pyruvate, water dikinase n=1 Tax=Natrialba aegyptia DSM 13077 TaxID=1227491 RepID=M0AUV9_9EURY|nr:PEP/pyruvate-binding domain-containing protein [Natrialba aegyptia]ELZ02102.1 phosphoenolpyruvate synthase / pyruvate, water dikinase [Natrialba aegyptia DSM 13077]
MEAIRTDATTAAYTVSFEDDAATDPSVTGGKGANLALLVDLDFAVPSGFCVTTAAYRALVDDADVRRAIAAVADLDLADADGISDRCATVRERITNAQFPDPVRRAIEETLAERSTDAVAIRSSATAEDLPTASFAGQHETFLGVHDRKAIFDRIRDCMASLFTERAVSYRLENDISHTTVAMAVVVQAVVEPEAAGVLFTADPVSGNRRVASVDANYGIGDTVVSGDVSPDNARVDRRTGDILEYEIGDKRNTLHLRADRDGTESVATEPDRRNSRVLSDAQLRELVELGDRVTDVFDSQQDIEWAIVDTEILLLQSRPITSLYPLPSPVPDDDRIHLYFSIGHQQAMAEALPPLVVDWVREMLENSAARLRSGDSTAPFTAAAGHRVYIDLNPLLDNGLSRPVAVCLLGAMSEPAATTVEDCLAERRERETAEKRNRLDGAVSVGRALRRLVPVIGPAAPTVLGRFIRPFVCGPPDPEHVRHRVELQGERMADRITQPSSQAARVRHAFDAVDHGTLVATVGSQSMPLLLAGLLSGAILERLFPDAEDELDALGKGFDDEIATQINQRLNDVTDIARTHPDVADALTAGDSLSEIERVDGGDEFTAAFTAFLDDFGSRASSEIDLSRPRWKDDPELLRKTIRSSLSGSDDLDHREHLAQLKADAERAAAELEARAGRGLLGPIRKPVVSRLLRVYRGGIQLREHHKHGVTRFLTAARDVFTEAGDSLAADGQIDQPDDVWFLRKDELLAALEDDSPIDVDIEKRRRAYNRDASLTAPPILTSDGETPAVTAAIEPTGHELVGTPVSSGIVEGPARVVTDPSEESLENGDILVAPSTDVGWTPLFQNAAGLVMEVGGRMTHGALVAREYGIPAVVSVSDVTAEIQSGERVRIDGSRGTVELLDRTDADDPTTAARSSGPSDPRR